MPALRKSTLRGSLTALAAAMAVAAPLAVAAPSSAAPGATSTDACTGVARCQALPSADVDGDGRADSVGVVVTREADGGRTAAVRVATAAGRLAATPVAVSEHQDYGVWHGAAALDGVPGAELSLLTEVLGDTGSYTVLTWRRGRLGVLASPYGRVWAIDVAPYVNSGWQRAGRDGTTYVVGRLATARQDGRHDLRTSTYRWSGSGWERSAYAKTRVSEERAWSVAGWRVKGLPAF